MIVFAIAFIGAGILCILATFPLHSRELAERPIGHWCMADVREATMGKGKTVKLGLVFWVKNNEIVFQGKFGEEGIYLKPGKQVPIIYNKDTNQVVLYPGKRSKKIQSGMMAMGMILSLAGAFISFFTMY